MLSYQQAVDYLESLIDYERSPADAAVARSWNLDRMRALLAHVGSPHESLRCAHIAGTKGKGSTAATLASIAQAAGHRVGLYTSPHLITMRERIRVNGALIDEREAAELVTVVRDAVAALTAGAADLGAPSFFEAYTLLALLSFARHRVDLAVLETGLGGRLDATNVVAPLVCGITTIARDHVVELGDDLRSIAREKAGIIKPGVPVVLAPQAKEVHDVIAAVAAERGAPLIRVTVDGDGDVRVVRLCHCERSQESRPREESPASAGIASGSLLSAPCCLSVTGRLATYRGLRSPLFGEHQLANIGVAAAMAEVLTEGGVTVEPGAIEDGVAAVRWPGRFQVVAESPAIVLDGAHDEASAIALRESLRARFPGQPVTLIVGVNHGHAPDDILRELCPAAARVVATASANPRALPPRELASIAGRYCSPTDIATDVGAALSLARESTARDGVVCVTGSLYLVGEAFTALGIDPNA